MSAFIGLAPASVLDSCPGLSDALAKDHIQSGDDAVSLGRQPRTATSSTCRPIRRPSSRFRCRLSVAMAPRPGAAEPLRGRQYVRRLDPLSRAREIRTLEGRRQTCRHPVRKVRWKAGRRGIMKLYGAPMPAPNPGACADLSGREGNRPRRRRRSICASASTSRKSIGRATHWARSRPWSWTTARPSPRRWPSAAISRDSPEPPLFGSRLEKARVDMWVRRMEFILIAGG